jgi:hypothetical protein
VLGGLQRINGESRLRLLSPSCQLRVSYSLAGSKEDLTWPNASIAEVKL